MPRKARPGDITPQLAEHLRQCGLPSLAAYRDWCRRHGFTTRADKTWTELGKEREAVRIQGIRDAHQQRPRLRDPMQALQQALDGTLDPRTVSEAGLQSACALLSGLRKNRPHREHLASMLRHVHGEAGFLLENDTVAGQPLPYLRGVVAVNERRGQWRRSLDDWRPRSHNHKKQFASLLRHLLADYPVPAFLDAAWLRRDRLSYAYRDLFIAIGRGEPIRTAKLPAVMNRKTLHHFLLAPDHYTIEGAVRWGQVQALGGSARLSDALVATPLGRNFSNDDFWQTVIGFFVQNPMLDTAQIGPIVDYIDHRKFRPTDVVQPDGTVVQLPPEQPGFSMARRTVESLIQHMERWHEALGHGKAGGPEYWAPSGIAELRWETGLKHKRIWTIRELRSRQALQLEGKTMGHCVASYSRSCAAGRCSIWSMVVTDKDGSHGRVTIEVSRQRVIVQCRGKRNALPEPQERDVLKRWAEQEKLGLATHL